MPNLSTLVVIFLVLDVIAFAGGIVFVMVGPRSDPAGEGMKWILPIMLALPLLIGGLLALLGGLWDGFKIGALAIMAAPFLFGLWGLATLPFQLLSERHPERSIPEGFPRGPARDLAAALVNGDKEAVQALLANATIDLTTMDGDRNTLFTVAVIRAPTLVPLLIQRGADPNFAPPDGEPPLFAALRGAPEAFALLLDQGADPNVRDRHGTPIFATCLLVERPDAVEALFAHGVDIHAADGGGWTLAMHAAVARAWPVVVALIERGIDLTAEADNGDSFPALFRRVTTDPALDERPAIEKVIAVAAARGVDLR